MRLEGRMKLGYYPLPEAEAQRIRRFLEFPSTGVSILDPCAGTGAALATIGGNANTKRYAIELDSYRAKEAQAAVDEVIQGNAFDCHAAVESFSLIYLNPPYDFELSEGKNQRMERLFLEHCYRWLAPHGVLVMVVPFDQIYHCRSVLNTQFRDKAIYRLTAPESVPYKQAVLFGVRRTRYERDRLADYAVQEASRKLWTETHQYEDIAVLPDRPDRVYPVPPSEAAHLEYRGLPLDLIEDSLAESPASLQARRITHAEKTVITGRPLTPLHSGHVGLLCTSGLLNGVFGEGEDRHVAYWEAVKVSDRNEEQDEQGRTLVRERERFSQRLTLLYRSGRFALLSESRKEKQGEKCAPSDGQADVFSPDEGHVHSGDAAP